MKKHLLRLFDVIALAIVLAAMCVALSGCFAVPVRAIPTDKPILVAPVGVQAPQADGTIALNPALPQPKADDFKPPAQFPWADILFGIVSLLAGGTGVGAVAIPLIGKARTALKIAAELADRNAVAETDADVEKNKLIALAKQREAGVLALTQKVRGK